MTKTVLASVLLLSAGLAVWAAQPPAANPAPAPPGDWVLPPDHPAITKALATKITVAFDKVPLHKIVAELNRQMKVSILLDFDGLAKVKVPADRPLTLAMADVPAEQVLQRLLQPLELVAVPRAEALEITDLDSERGKTTTRLYLIADMAFVRQGKKLRPIASTRAPNDPFDDVGTAPSLVDGLTCPLVLDPLWC